MRVDQKAIDLLIHVPIKRWMILFREYRQLQKKIFRLTNEMNARNKIRARTMSKARYKTELGLKIEQTEDKYKKLLLQQASEDMNSGKSPGEIFIQELVELPKFLSVLKNLLLIIDEVENSPVAADRGESRTMVEISEANERVRKIQHLGLKLGMWDYSPATGEPEINIDSCGRWGEAINLYLQQANRDGNDGKLFDPRSAGATELRPPSKEDKKILEKIFVYNPHNNQLEIRA